MVSNFYTPLEIAKILKVTEEDIVKEITSKNLKSIEVAGVHRISEDAFKVFITGGSQTDPASVKLSTGNISASLKKIQPFSYRWPNGIEDFDKGFEGYVSFEGKSYPVKVGINKRRAYGKERGHSVVLVRSYPVTEFVETDSKTWTSLLPGHENPRRNLGPNDPIATEFRQFKITNMRDAIDGPNVPHALAIEITNPEPSMMAMYGVIKAKRKGRLG